MEHDRSNGELNTILNKDPNATSIHYLLEGRMAKLKDLADESVNGIKHEIYVKGSTGEHVTVGAVGGSAGATGSPMPTGSSPQTQQSTTPHGTPVRAKASAKAQAPPRPLPPANKRGRPTNASRTQQSQ